MYYFKKSLQVLALLTITLLLAAPAIAADPMTKPNDTWITVSGIVESVSPDSFRLDYGEGSITVEMDDGDRDADGYKLLEGDVVTVSGIIDDGFYEKRTIEASSVYVEKLNTYFYASAADEEDVDYDVTYYAPLGFGRTTMQGTVTAITGSEEFQIDTGLRTVTVEVDALPYNPLDTTGYQRIKVGDRVSVTGRMDDDLFEGRELVADSIVTLSKRRP